MPKTRIIQDRTCRKTGSNVVVDFGLNEPGLYQITCYGCGICANVDTQKAALWLAADPHYWGCECPLKGDA